MQRRRFFREVAAVGSAALVAAALREPAISAPDRAGHSSIRLGFTGRPCEAVTLTAPGAAAFRRAGLNVRLMRFQTESELIFAVGAGTVDAASATLPALLPPLAQGSDVRLVAGLHAGCLRIVALDAVEMVGLADLRGKSIATDRLAGAAMNLLSALLYKTGIDPRRDVSWQVYAPADLETALDAKTVACVATSDPLGYLLLREKKAEPYLDPTSGGFSCGGDIAHSHHCFLALHGALIRRRPALAATLTRAYLQASTSLPGGIGPAALAEVRGNYVNSDLSVAIGMLSTYDWSASTEFVLEEIELTARDFKRAALLERHINPQQLAENSFVDILHA